MYFDSLAAFISMGGHGKFVFAAYGITLFVILLLTYLPLSKKKRLLLRIKQQQRFNDKRENK